VHPSCIHFLLYICEPMGWYRSRRMQVIGGADAWLTGISPSSLLYLLRPAGPLTSIHQHLLDGRLVYHVMVASHSSNGRKIETCSKGCEQLHRRSVSLSELTPSMPSESRARAEETHSPNASEKSTFAQPSLTVSTLPVNASSTTDQAAQSIPQWGLNMLILGVGLRSSHGSLAYKTSQNVF
jgi:hypothetical protein